MYKADDIYNWLQTATDFTEGIKIFNFFSKINFDKKFPPHMLERVRLANLKYELNKLLKVQKNNIVKQALPVVLLEQKPNSVEEHKEVIDAINLPYELQKKWIQKGKLWNQIGLLRKNLWSESKEERKEAAQEIVKLTKENRKLWEELEYFKQHGVEMKPADDHSADVEISQLSVAELLVLSKNLPPWISKEKRKIASELDEKEKKRRIKELQSNETKLKTVKSILLKL